MSQLAERLVPELPQKIKKVLDEFLASAQKGLVTDLTSAVLFGSAAEGRLRATSDVNLLLVMSRFQQENIDLLREPLRFAAAAIQLRVMFLLEDEVAAASVAFALKFADLQHRHVVLFGTDPFAQLQIPRTAEVFRLQQVLLNLVLRLREA